METRPKLQGMVNHPIIIDPELEDHENTGLKDIWIMIEMIVNVEPEIWLFTRGEDVFAKIDEMYGHLEKSSTPSKLDDPEVSYVYVNGTKLDVCSKSIFIKSRFEYWVVMVGWMIPRMRPDDMWLFGCRSKAMEQFDARKNQYQKTIDQADHKFYKSKEKWILVRKVGMDIDFEECPDMKGMVN